MFSIFFTILDGWKQSFFPCPYLSAETGDVGSLREGSGGSRIIRPGEAGLPQAGQASRDEVSAGNTWGEGLHICIYTYR